MKSIYLKVILILFLIGLSFAGESKVKVTGIFSNLEYNEEGGDLLGKEIIIILGKEDYFVVFEVSEGGPSDPVLTKAKITGNKIEFTIPEGQLVSGKFVGKISEKQLIGKFENQEDTIKLKRKKSYWE
jgi:hypothetical protein